MREWRLVDAEPVREWHIGRIKVTKIPEVLLESTLTQPGVGGILPEATGAALLAMPWLVPDFVTPSGALKLSIHSFVVETPELTILVDTCNGNDKPRPRSAFLNRLSTAYLTTLTAAGYHRSAINRVICTHLHADHVGWNTMFVDSEWVPTFPNARYLFGQLEYDELMGNADKLSAHSEMFDDSVRPVVDAGLNDFVASDAVITRGVRLIPTPGHTPGHVSVMIEDDGQRALITGDAIHHPCQVAHPEWTVQVDDCGELARETRKQLVADAADTDLLVIGTHWSGRTSGRIVSRGDGYVVE